MLITFYILYQSWKWKIRKATVRTAIRTEWGDCREREYPDTPCRRTERRAEDSFCQSPLDKQGYPFLQYFPEHAWYKKSFDHRGQKRLGQIPARNSSVTAFSPPFRRCKFLQHSLFHGKLIKYVAEISKSVCLLSCLGWSDGHSPASSTPSSCLQNRKTH